LSAKDSEQILKVIEQVEASILVHDENGLFRHLEDRQTARTQQTTAEKITYEACQNLLLRARKALFSSHPDARLARKLTDLAQHKLNTAFDQAGWYYRWKYVTPVFMLVYLLLAFAAIIVVDLESPPAVLFQVVPLWAFLGGAMGAILRAYWSLWNSASTRTYRKAWTVWFIGSPVFGGIFGALMYTAFLSGLVAVSSSQSKIENIALPLFLTGLAGFASESAKDLLTNIQEAIAGKK
jgi:hypothetical protein